MQVITKGIFGITFASLSLWLLWYEFTGSIFEDRTFLLLVMMWALMGLVFFLDEWNKAERKTTSEKMDELITEIKADREQRDKEWALLVKELKRRKK